MHGGVGGATNAREQLRWKLARAFIAELLDDVAHGVLYVGMEPTSASGAEQRQVQVGSINCSAPRSSGPGPSRVHRSDLVQHASNGTAMVVFNDRKTSSSGRCAWRHLCIWVSSCQAK